MLARLRIVVPDRPGSLGQLATVIGAENADVSGLRVLESEAGRATDDVVVDVRDDDHLDRVRRRLAATPGIDVLGHRAPVPELTGHAELELVGQVLARPSRGTQTLVDGAPKAFDVDWAAVVALDEHGYVQAVTAMSVPGPGEDAVQLPGPVRLAVVPMTKVDGDGAHEGTALVPLGDRPLGLVLVRECGLGFHTGELWRLSALAGIVATALPA